MWFGAPVSLPEDWILGLRTTLVSSEPLVTLVLDNLLPSVLNGYQKVNAHTDTQILNKRIKIGETILL